jgi:hypothetical protein
MKYVFLSIILIGSTRFSEVNAQISINKIDSLDMYGDTKKAIQLSLEYLKINGNKKSLVYNTACRYAKIGNIDSAFIFLDLAIQIGLKEIYYLVDEDLNCLRNEKRWERIEKCVIDEFMTKNSSILNPALAIEICKMGHKDQNGRQKILLIEQIGGNKVILDSLWTLQKKQDSISTVYITNLITNNFMQFPSKLEIGENASRYAFLMLQHSSYSVRKKHYQTIKKAMKNNELDKKYYAMYIDRLLVDEGKKQLYGTQMYKNTEGVLIEYPVKRKHTLRARRSKVGFL